MMDELRYEQIVNVPWEIKYPGVISPEIIDKAVNDLETEIIETYDQLSHEIIIPLCNTFDIDIKIIIDEIQDKLPSVNVAGLISEINQYLP